MKFAADHFRQCYIASKHNVSADEWPPFQPKHYTTLALIHVEKHTSTEVISVTKELASKGKIENKGETVLKCHDDNICYQSKSISDIFSENLPTGRYLILIEGAPGIGKTVLSKEIAFQWASNNLLSNKKLVFLVSLRDLNSKNVKSLEDLMDHVFKINVTNSLAKYLCKTNGKDVTIILDGYDEMSEENRKNSLIADIINFNVLPECGLIITSRPTASVYLHDKADCRVEILGFTEADRLEYIEHALQGNDNKIKEIKSYLESHSTINALCYIPLNMTILLSLFEETSSSSQANTSRLPNTQTEMCEKFISTIIRRFMNKILQTEFVSAPELSDLPEPHNKVFHELSKLAYDALIKDQIVFTKQEIDKACPHLVMRRDNWNGLGLIRAAQHGIDSVSFHFLHFSVQEYMAAYFIAAKPDKEQLKLLKTTFWDIHYFNTWIMYIGVTHGESFAWKHFLSGNWFHFSTRVSNMPNVSKKLLQNKIKCLHLFQCFTEGSSANVEQLAKSFFEDRIIDLSNQTLQPKDVNILGFFLLRTVNKHWKRINLSRCNLRNVGCIALCKMFMDKTNREMLKVDEIDFSYNQLQRHTITTLLDIFNSWNTTDVIICDKNNDFYMPNEELEYFEEIILNVDLTKKFQSISIGQSLFGNKTTQTTILNHLSRSTFFTGLYLNDCIWQEKNSLNKSFVDLISKQKLSKIHIIGKTNAYCIKGLAEAVKQAQTIFIYDETLADKEVDKIGSTLLSKAGISDVALVIGQNKIVGKLHTSSLNKKLSPSEIYHVFSNIVNLCSIPSKPLVNYFKLNHSSHDSKSLHDLFILLQNNPINCQISICLVKDYDVLVAHKCKYEDIIASLYKHPSLSSVYISYCEFSKTTEFNKFIDLVCIQRLLVKCYILNSSLETDLAEYACLQLIRSDSRRKALALILHSIHPSCEMSSNILNCDDCIKDSIMLITKDTIVGHNITYEQLSSSQQLQSQVTAWKLWHCQLNYMMLDFINNIQHVETNHLTELTLLYCIHGDNHFFKNIQHFTTLTTFNVSGLKCSRNIIEEMALFLLHNTQLKELNVSNLKLGLKNFKLLVKSLKNHSNLTKLNISNIGTVFEKYIAVVLSNNINIEELDLSGLKTFKHDSSKPFVVIANSLSNFSCLKMLNISNNNITADVIGDILSHNTKLEHLNLSNLSLCLEDFMTIARKAKNISSLRSLDISRNNAHNNASDSDDSDKVTDDIDDYLYHSTDCVAAIFLHNLKLEELNLSDLELDSEDFVNIATALSKLSNLRKLDISGSNYINDNVTDVLITLLKNNISLEVLDISGIEYEEGKNLSKLAKALQKLPNLTKIDIELCDEVNDINIGASLFAEISRSLFNSNASEIILGYEFEFFKDFFEIPYDLNKVSACIIAAYLSKNTTLKRFIYEMDDDEATVADVIKIFKSMKNISTLKRFEICGHEYADQAANAIAEVLANNRQLEEIDISCNSLRPVSAIKIFNGMKNLTNLITLDVSLNDIADKEAYEGTEILAPIVSQISHLSTKPVTYTAVQRLAFVLDCNPKLQKLDIEYLYLNPEEVAVLLEGMKNLTSLTILNIGFNEMSNETATILASILSCNISLQELNLCKCSLQTEGAVYIFNAITSHPHLSSLNIGYNKISNEAAAVLASMLSCNISLQKLMLNKCSLQTEGTMDIFNAITNHSRLLVLDIGDNEISNKAAAVLASMLSCNISLQKLMLHKCSLQTEGTMDIFNAITNHSHLLVLDIGDNEISNKAAAVLASMLSCNISLHKLNLCKCSLQTEGAMNIFNAIINHSHLSVLDAGENNDVGDEAAVALRAVLSSNPKLTYSIPHNIQYLVTPNFTPSTTKESPIPQHNTATNVVIQARAPLV